MNRTINLTLFVIIMFILGGLIAREYGIYKLNKGRKEGSIDGWKPKKIFDGEIQSNEAKLAKYEYLVK